MRQNSYLGVALAALSSLFAATSVPINVAAPPREAFLMPSMPAIAPKARKRRRTTLHARNGKREVARRLRQIAAGQLTRSNGLVEAHELPGYNAAA